MGSAVSGPFNRPSPAELRGLINDLREFRNAYVAHLNATLPSVMQGDHVGHSTDRTRVLRLAVRAERAVSLTGIKVAIAPPPVAVGKPALIGLVTVAFAHEDPTYRMTMDPLLFPEDHKQGFDLALDTVDMADETLCRMFEEERTKRRRPTYWIDRALRAVLGFPAYLISLLLGFDRLRLSPGKAQTLWVLSVIADVAALVALGRALGWW